MAESIIKNEFKSENVTAEYLVTVMANSGIFAKRTMNVLIVYGYIRPQSAVSANTTIASVGIRPINEVFSSSISSSGNGGRLVLRTNGQIQVESALNAGEWYSFTFVTFVN